MNTKEITHILELVYKNDQQAIRDFRAGKIDAVKLKSINLENIRILQEILKNSDFPTINRTSHLAYKAAILVTLHSGDLKLLNTVIDFIQKVPKPEVEKSDIAFLIDKSRILKNLPQLYGTQFKKRVDGVIEFIEIEDLNNIDKRRAELDMEPFESYRKKSLLY